MRHIIPIFIVITLLVGCRDKVICPAFQSTYILDDSVRTVFYSYLWKLDKEERLKYLAENRSIESTAVLDSSNVGISMVGIVNEGTDYFEYVEPYVVKPKEVRKSKFGIVKYEPYWLKNYRLKTAPMENVLTPPEVVEDTAVDVGEFVASDFNDSVAIDSSMAITGNVQSDSSGLASADYLEGDSSFFELPKLAQAKPPETKQVTTYLYRYDPEDKLLNVEQEYYNWYFGEQLVHKETVPINPHPSEGAKRLTFWQKVKNFFSFKWMFKGKKSKDESVDSFTEDDAFSEEGGVSSDSTATDGFGAGFDPAEEDDQETPTDEEDSEPGEGDQEEEEKEQPEGEETPQDKGESDDSEGEEGN